MQIWPKFFGGSDNISLHPQSLGITTDNAENNNTMCKKAEELTANMSFSWNTTACHVFCGCHVLNLVCQEGFSAGLKVTQGIAVEDEEEHEDIATCKH